MAKRNTVIRRKANAYLKYVLGNGWIYQTLGKSTAKSSELLAQINEIDGTNYSTLKSWNHGNGFDLPAPVPESVKRSKKKQNLKKPTQKAYPQSDDFLLSWEWTTLRYEILDKHGRRCMCCGATPDDGVTILNVDHIKPRSKFPKLALDPENLQVLCHPCNKGKGAWDETDFRYNSKEYEFQCDLAHKARSIQ